MDGLLLDVGDGHMVECMRRPDRLGGSIRSVVELRHNKGNEATFGIWRVDGPADSAVLKIFRPPTGQWSAYWPTSNNPAHWNYWRREPLTYRTGLASSAYGTEGIVPPDLLDAADRPDGMIEIWLEYVDGLEGFSWTPARIGRYAYELGAGQARWVGRVPATEWLSRRWLAQYMAEGPSRGVDIGNADWDDDRVAAWPRQVRQQLMRLWRQRGRALAATEAAERTLCHLDVWPANSIDSQGRSVQLDWAFVGEGAVGEDVGSLILHCFTDGLVPPSLLPEVTEASVNGYLHGLADGGWSGSSDKVRATIAVSGAAKYSWFGPTILGRVLNDDLGTSNYSMDDSAASAVVRTTELVSLIADWSKLVFV
jgi:hypothetical protein